MAVYLLIRYQKQLSLRVALILGVIAGLSFLTKILGMAVFLSTLLLMIVLKIEKRKISLMIEMIEIFSLFVLGFLFYGHYFGADLFWQIQAYQATRNLGINTLWTLLLKPVIANKIFFDGWYYWCFFCLFFLFVSYQKFRFIILPSFIYLFLLLNSVRQTDLHGWYALPLFPFLALAAGIVFNKLIKKLSWLILIFVLLAGVHQVDFLYRSNFGLTAGVFRFFLLILFGPFLFSLIFKRERMYRLLSWWWFSIFIFLNVMTVWYYVHPA